MFDLKTIFSAGSRSDHPGRKTSGYVPNPPKALPLEPVYPNLREKKEKPLSAAAQAKLQKRYAEQKTRNARYLKAAKRRQVVASRVATV
jgi:hypothetical protein